MLRQSMAVMLVVFAAAGRSAANENDWFIPLGRPPKASPRRISGGEALPPLPLPATPLRRSERKRQPSPPALVAKIVWGESAMFTYENGISAKVADWNLCPADLQQLLGKSGRWAGLSYSSKPMTLLEFHGDPAKLPLLLFNGGRSIRLDKNEQAILRSFVMKGGMVLFDSIAGSPYFYESSKKAAREAFPEYELRRIPLDHPVYHMLSDATEVSYPKNLDSQEPFLEGMYIGSRIGVLISKYGLGCSWDDHEVPLIDKAIYYDVASGIKLGLNMIAYAVGYAGVGIEEAKPELFGSLDEKTPTDEFVFAQIRHRGAWNVHPGGAAALLRRLRHDTALGVSLKRVPVTLGTDDILSFPFLYLTGLDDFRFSGKEVSALRNFLNSSGTLFINNGLGMQTFDQAVRRELTKILPESRLEPVPLEHPIYSSVFTITEAAYTPATLKAYPDMTAPTLLGVHIDGSLRVIYSPFDMESSWLGCEYPLARAYRNPSGMQLGMNVVMYSATH